LEFAVAVTLPCPEVDVWQRLLLGNIPDAEAESLSEHLVARTRCTQAVQTVQAEDLLTHTVRAAAHDGKDPDDTAIQGLIERLCSTDAPCAQQDTNEPTGEYSQTIEEITPELYDFLAPPQEAGEIGRLGPYRVRKVLGIGGMGIVFQAEDPQLQRPVALKTMKRSLAADAVARRRFFREAQAAAALVHDHIVTIHQVAEDRGIPFLAMQLLQGETLEDRQKRENRLPLAEVLRIGREISQGLGAAHERGLIHRDIKPANIWLESRGGVVSGGVVSGKEGSRPADHSPLTTHHSPARVKILDFGLARVTGAGESMTPDTGAAQEETSGTALTIVGAIMGTPAYMAPEQASGGVVDARCDLFSLGCVLYRMCTGAVPFQGVDKMATLRALTYDDPRPPVQLNPAVPPALSALILKLLAKRPEDRYPSAYAVVEALAAIEKEQLRGPQPSPRRQRRLVLAAAVLVGLLVAAGFLFGPSLFRSGTGPDNPSAPPPKKVASSRPCNFALQVNYPVGLKPYAVAVGDFNGDGKQDVAVSNIGSDTASVLLGNGDGTFRKAVEYPAGATPHGLAVGDFNGDGKQDLVVCNLDSNSVSVLLGNGDGTFKPPVSYATGEGARGAAVGDFNGDGVLDLAVANYKSSTVSVLLGNGDGTFQKAVHYLTGAGAVSVAVADFNSDGKLDLVVSNGGRNTVTVLLGNGNGSFQSAVNIAVGSYPQSVAVADVNGDGRPDLVTANSHSNTVSVLLGNGNGTFQSAVNFSVGTGPVAVAVADVNGDGHPDLVTANRTSNNVSVLLGNGDGTFHSAVNFAVRTTPLDVAVGDFNGDRFPDLVVANAGSNNVSVLLGNGNGSFKSAVNYNVGAAPFAVAVADVNGDGRQDLVVANRDSNSVSVLLGNSNGTFGAATNFAVGLEPYSVAVADVNGDGIPDVVAANGGSNTVSVLLGQRNAATHFTVKAPASVTGLTAGNQLDPLYTGTVHFTSSDSSAILPADYTFKLRDTGSHTFTVTLNTTGSQTITATDKNHSSIKGTATVSVGAAPPPGRSSGGGDSAEAAVAAAASPLFLGSDGTARLPALSAFRTIDAGTHRLTALLTSAGDQTIPAAEPATHLRGMAPVTVGAAMRRGQPLDAEVNLLNPARVEAFFALEDTNHKP
jgi:serine/threonine protein kinase